MVSGLSVVFTSAQDQLCLQDETFPDHASEGCVLVKMEAATICGSDLHTFQGRRMEATPLVLGHEGVGRVVSSGRAGLEVGCRVTWSIADSCGACRMCDVLKMPQKCSTALLKYGHSKEALTGCYSSHILLRPGTEIIPVPDSIPASVVAPLNCALATVFASLENVGNPSVALVQGAGLLGIYATLILKRLFQTETVYIKDTVPSRLAIAEKFGATVGDVPAGSCDLVLEVCGASRAVADGLVSVRVGGVYVWVGMVTPQSELPITGEQVVRKCLTIRGVHNYAPRHLRQAVDFICSLPQETIDLLDRELVSPQIFPLTQLQDAFEYALKGEYCRVMVDCQTA